MNSSVQLLLLRSAHTALHCIVGLLMAQHRESWTQAMPGEPHLLHTPSRKFLPAGPLACLASQRWEKGWAVCREMSEVVCIMPIHTVSVCKSMTQGPNYYSASTMSLLHRLRSICIVSNMTFTVDTAAWRTHDSSYINKKMFSSF